MIKKLLLGLGLITALFALSVISATLTVNLGSRGREVVMPDLKGMEIVPAIETLEKLGLNLKISGKEYDDNLPVGAIISHKPSAGNLSRMGRSVEAIISVGPRRVPVPDVREDFALRAQSILLQNGLKIGLISSVPSRRWPRDTIISQSPAPPAIIEKNTAVDLLISTGPPSTLYVMPDFIGFSLSRTVGLIQKAGLEISQVTYQKYPGVSPGTVVGQKPPLGTPINRMDPIELAVVSSEEGEVRKKVKYSLLSFYVPEGFRPRQVKVIIQTETSTYEALNETRPPGGRVQVLVEVDGKTKAMIYVDDNLQDTRYF